MEPHKQQKKMQKRTREERHILQKVRGRERPEEEEEKRHKQQKGEGQEEDERKRERSDINNRKKGKTRTRGRGSGTAYQQNKRRKRKPENNTLVHIPPKSGHFRRVPRGDPINVALHHTASRNPVLFEARRMTSKNCNLLLGTPVHIHPPNVTPCPHTQKTSFVLRQN